MEPRTAVLNGYGLNSEKEVAFSMNKAGGNAKIIHLTEILEAPELLDMYNILVLPGGASFGDALGAGKILANKIKYSLRYHLEAFSNNNKLIFGICNGFQILSKIGMLPILDFEQRITLTVNESAKFEDRWVYLKVNRQTPAIALKNTEYLFLPVRNGEGRVIVKDDDVLNYISNNNLISLQYVDEKGTFAGYPYNPTGSVLNIAGICDKSGRVFGMLPCPEAFNNPQNSPFWGLNKQTPALGLKIFENLVAYIKSQSPLSQGQKT